MNKDIELFVSPDGNDSAAGTIDSPLATLVGAKNKVKQIHEKSKLPINVYFRQGTYSIDKNAAVFTAEDSGYTDAEVAYRAYKNEAASFEGGIEIDLSCAQKVNDNALLERIIEKSARGKVYAVDISKYIDLMPSPDEIASKGTPMLFMDGKPMHFARWPNKKYENIPTNETWLFTPHVQHGNPPRTTPFDVCTEYSVIDHIKRFWSKESIKNAWLAGYLWHNWSFDCYRINDVDFERNTINAQTKDNSALPYLCDPEPCYKYRRFYLYNVLEELSEPSEYYIDRENKILYCILENTNTSIHLITPCAPVFSFKGAHNITVDGLSFAYADCEYIYGNNSSHITVKNCTLSCGSEDAVDFGECPDLKVLNNHIFNMGSGGVLAHGAGNMRTLTPGNILIEGNDIHDVTLQKPCGSCAINLWSSVGTLVRKNKLHSSPHMLLFIDGIDTIVEYNEIYDAALDTDDASAVYWGRTACTIGTRIRYNYFHDIGQNNTGTWSIGAIYTDDLATGAEIYGNLFIKAAIFGDDNTFKQTTHYNSVICLNAAQFVSVHDNIFLASTVRENPMSDVGHHDTVEWVKGSIGAYIPHNSETRGLSMQWREPLEEIGFYGEDGMTPSEAWHEHYKNTCWEDMFKLLAKENFVAGAKDENGNVYGIPDIRRRFAEGELTVQEVNEVFNDYMKQIMAKYGDDYSVNYFERNIVIGMDSKFIDENGVYHFDTTHNSNNIYISEEQANMYFENPAEINYTLTDDGRKNISGIIPNLDCIQKP